MKCPFRLLLFCGSLLLAALSVAPAAAQTSRFSKGDSIAFMVRCHDALDAYSVALNEVGFAESAGAANGYRETLVSQSFYNPQTLVFSDLSNERYTIKEYAHQFYFYRANAQFNLNGERYQFSRSSDGKIVLISYVSQTTNFKKAGSVPSHRTTTLAIQFTFDVVIGPRGFEPQNYKIVRIDRVAAVPAGATAFPANADLNALREPTLSWAALRLAHSLSAHLTPGAPVVVRKFSYRNSQLTNAFSDELLGELRQRLKADEKVNVVADDLKQGVGVRGSYQQKGDLVEITAELFDLATGQTTVKVKPNMDLPVTWVQQKGLVLKPEHNDAVLATQRAIDAGALPAELTHSEALRVTLTTTQSRQRNFEFWENDTLHVNVRVNKPCHVRLAYVQTDNVVTLLWDDFEIKPGQENKDIPFPERFQCVPPFGQETLIATVSTTRFCPVETRANSYGVDVVTGSLEEALKRVRCVAQNGGPAVQKAEARLILTTRPIQSATVKK